VNNFVDAILAVDGNARIVVLGDLNDFQFSTPLATLKGGVLTNLTDSLLESERYSYVFDGNSQALEHILVSASLLNALPEYDFVHVNSEFAVQASDHDPALARFLLPSSSTEIVLRSFGASRSGRSVVLRWRTGSERVLLGYNVYRESKGKRAKLNRALIGSKGAAGGWYSYRTRAPSSKAPTRYWLQEVHTDGSRRWYGPVRA